MHVEGRPRSIAPRSYEDAEDEDLLDGKSIRINQTRYEFHARATLIPMDPAPADDDDPSKPWDSEENDNEDLF